MVRLATVVADYMVEVAYKTYKSDSIDRIMELVLLLAQDGFPPLQLAGRAVADVLVVSRGGATPSLLRKRSDQCFRLGKLFSKILGTQHVLVKETFRVAHELQSWGRS